MSKKLTILFFPVDAHGHINSCHGIAEVLRQRNHRIVFAIEIAFKGKLIPYGFEEEVYRSGTNANNEEYWPEVVRQRPNAFRVDAIEAVKQFLKFAFTSMHNTNKALDTVYADIISRVKPDIIVVDMYTGSPTLTNSGIPWVWLVSASPPIMFDSDDIPPYGSGLSTNGDKQEWKQFKEKRDQLLAELYEDINAIYVQRGAQPLQPYRLHPTSPFLNIYLYPEELMYEQLKPIPKNFFGLDTALRTTSDQFSLPTKLASNYGKLIFFSMGSFGCANLELMTRLTQILAKSPNRFIVSKGSLHDKYELPDNMWGQKSVPQTAVLPIVDLVIAHGGNNTVTESFYFGKPMIILPLFSDQYDNAQRLEDLGYGKRLHPFHCTESELLTAIDELLANNVLIEKMRLIGERIRNSDCKERAADLVENIVNKAIN